MQPELIVESALESSVDLEEILELRSKSWRLRRSAQASLPSLQVRYSAAISPIEEDCPGDAYFRIMYKKTLYSFLIDVQHHGPKSCSVALDIVNRINRNLKKIYAPKKSKKRKNKSIPKILKKVFVNANKYLCNSRQENQLQQELLLFLENNPSERAIRKKVKKLKKEKRRDRFAATIGSALHLPTRKLYVVNGSGLQSVIYRGESNYSMEDAEIINSCPIPLGLFTEDLSGNTYASKLRVTQHDLSPGDFFVSYTDGFPEMKDPNCKEFGERRFQKHIATLISQEHNPATSMPYFFEKPEGYEAQDDRTLVCLEVQ